MFFMICKMLNIKELFMSFAQRIAVAVNLNEPHMGILKTIKHLDFFKDSEIHFVTVHMTTTFAIGLGESSIVYPLLDDQKKIQESSLSALNNLSEQILGSHFKGKVFTDCLFSDNPKSKFCDYLEQNKIDTVITTARSKKGFFESSFTQYVNKHSHANMIILKQKN